MKRGVVLSLAIALIAALAFSVVSPAFGGPSPLSLARKALRQAKQAKQTAADGPRMTFVSAEVSVPPASFGTAELTCPPGSLVSGSAISPGATVPVGEAVAAGGVAFSGFNPSNNTTFSYSAQVECVKSSGFSRISSSSMADARRQAAKARSDYLAAR